MGRYSVFLGPNGADKSTTIKILTMLLRSDGGSVSILGLYTVKEPLKARRRIGAVQ